MTTLDDVVTSDAWDAIANDYDRFVTPTANWQVGESALDRVDVGPGTRLLDIACGSGALSIPAARRGAQVVGVDFSPAMIARLEARAYAEGLTGQLTGRVMDGHHLDVVDDTFDVAGSQFGVMLFPDQPQALREMVRVTRPGGQVLVVAYRPPEEVEFLTFFLGAVQAVVPGFEGPSPDEPMLPFQAADPAVLRGRMEDAGLHDVSVEHSIEPLEFGSGGQLWDWLMGSNPIPGALTKGLTDEQRVQVRQVLDRMLRERSAGRLPATLTAGINLAVGTV
jgi:ubiquinone/menaquinone biosynthesis C-methylase UbiE